MHQLRARRPSRRPREGAVISRVRGLVYYPLARDGSRSDGVWAGVRAVWCGCGLGGCAGGVRGCATAVCRETRAEHDAAAINTGPPSRLAAADRERSRPMRGATRGRVLAWCPLSQPLALLLCAVRVRARMSNKKKCCRSWPPHAWPHSVRTGYPHTLTQGNTTTLIFFIIRVVWALPLATWLWQGSAYRKSSTSTTP